MDSYDSHPYTEHAYAESHPDHLAVIAALHGFRACVSAPRVLEIGCGRGANLLALASSWPDASCVGIDLSQRQIDHAQRLAAEAGIANARFLACDFATLNEDAYDFVLCHGVLTWVPAPARAALLQAIRRSLATLGVAFVSFNVLPGWYERLAARDWVRFATDVASESPAEALAWLVRHASPERAVYRASLDGVLARIGSAEAGYVRHEYLAEDHHPLHVKTFLAEAASAGLTYVGDALPRETAAALLPDGPRDLAARLRTSDREQLADYVLGTAFRRSLLVRSDVTPAPGDLGSSALVEMRLASRFVDKGGGSFSSGRDTVQVAGIAQALLSGLAEVAPHSVPFGELAGRIGAPKEALAREAWDLWLAADGLDLHLHQPPLAPRVSERPLASPLVRLRAARDEPITNAWHQEVVLPDSPVRAVLAMLDQTRTAKEIAACLPAEVRPAEPDDARTLVTASLELLYRSALLVS